MHNNYNNYDNFSDFPVTLPAKKIKVSTALLIFAVLCVAAAIALSFVRGASPVVPATTTTAVVTAAPTATATSIPGSMTEAEFDADVRSKLPGVSTSDTKSIGRSLCSMIKNSNVDDAMVTFARQASRTSVDARSAAIVALDGVSTYCPEYIDALNSWSHKK